MNEPFNTTMRDRLMAALVMGTAKSHNKQRVLVGRSANGRFKSIRTICTNDGAQGVVGTPCPKCSRKL